MKSEIKSIMSLLSENGIEPIWFDSPNMSEEVALKNKTRYAEQMYSQVCQSSKFVTKWYSPELIIKLVDVVLDQKLPTSTSITTTLSTKANKLQQENQQKADEMEKKRLKKLSDDERERAQRDQLIESIAKNADASQSVANTMAMLVTKPNEPSASDPTVANLTSRIIQVEHSVAGLQESMNNNTAVQNEILNAIKNIQRS